MTETNTTESAPAARQCSLCGRSFTGHGHNPAPLQSTDQPCCDSCNATLVIPARLAALASTTHNHGE
jgi:hypothetical protein